MSESVPLTATIVISSSWGTGYTAQVQVKNTSSSAISSWKVVLQLPEGHTLSNLWDGISSVSGRMVTVSNPSWGGSLAVNASASFGFNANVVPVITSPTVSSATGSGSSTPQPPPIPSSPNLSVIALSQDNSYTVSWTSSANATTYSLQEDDNGAFSSPEIVFSGSATSRNFSGKLPGTYYYRVQASNASGSSAFSSIQSVTVPQAPSGLAAPILADIRLEDDGSYRVSWSAVQGADSYVLESDTSSSFSAPKIASIGNVLFKTFANPANGLYFYRVKATSPEETSPYSAIKSVRVGPPPTQNGPFVEGYWESWDSSVPVKTIAGMKVDIIDISFGNIIAKGNHTFAVEGVESDPTQLINEAHALGKKVKIAIGGATYHLEGKLVSNEDAVGVAKAIVAYMQQHSLDGIDLDIEDNTPANLQIALMREIRNLVGDQVPLSYTAGTPAALTPKFKNVIQGGHQFMTTLSLMAYDAFQGYSYQQDVNDLVALGVPKSKIVPGFMPGRDDIGIMTSLADISNAAQYVKSNGLAGIMFWDLNRDFKNVTQLGASAATNTAYPIIHS